MINRYFHHKADKVYRVFSYIIFQTEEQKNIRTYNIQMAVMTIH